MMEVGLYMKVDIYFCGLVYVVEGFGYSVKGGLDGEIYYVIFLVG